MGCARTTWVLRYADKSSAPQPRVLRCAPLPRVNYPCNQGRAKSTPATAGFTCTGVMQSITPAIVIKSTPPPRVSHASRAPPPLFVSGCDVVYPRLRFRGFLYCLQQRPLKHEVVPRCDLRVVGDVRELDSAGICASRGFGDPFRACVATTTVVICFFRVQLGRSSTVLVLGNTQNGCTLSVSSISRPLPVSRASGAP